MNRKQEVEHNPQIEPKGKVTLSSLIELMLDLGIAEDKKKIESMIKEEKRHDDGFESPDTVIAERIILRKAHTHRKDLISGKLAEENLPRTEEEELADKAFYLSYRYMEAANVGEDTTQIVNGLGQIGQRLKELNSPELQRLKSANTPLKYLL